MPDKTPSCRRAPAQRQWRTTFLAELAATPNVAASARKAGVSASHAYEVRRRNAEFYREWQEALCEGYDHLEMNLLHRLREGEIRPATGAKRGAARLSSFWTGRQCRSIPQRWAPSPGSRSWRSGAATRIRLAHPCSWAA